ncbi:MAG: DNA repair protein RecO [Alphaproteobacteria bacterium]|nr:DNA repair protein RecO [Alphaproteobacteria bacterium]
MEWTDDAIVLGVRPFGEHSAVLEALTRSHGRHLGLVRGASSKRTKGMLEPGNILSLHWRARLDQQLGNYSLELVAARAAHFFEDALKLDGLTAACAMCAATLPEREVHGRVYDALDGLLQMMMRERSPDWVKSHVEFELVLLEDLGFGLDLSQCAVTGAKSGLTHVSPKTGRAVTAVAARPYAGRLLPLPPFLVSHAYTADVTQLAEGLALTGFFLERIVLEPHGGVMPLARLRLTQRLAADKADR